MESVLRDKSFAFAVRMVRVSQHLQTERREYVLARQLLRCGTAVGAMVREAEYAESRPDFIHKMAVALKEANETPYWLDLLAATQYLTSQEAVSLINEITELLKMLTATIKTTKKNLP